MMLVTVALFGSLYLVTATSELWKLVLGIHVLSLLVVAFWLVKYRTTSAHIAGGRITLRRFPYPARRIPSDEVERFVLASVYISGTTDTHTHLAALDSHGRLLFRMRTKYWTLEDIHRVVTAIGAPVTSIDHIVTPAEFAEEFTR